MSVTTDRRSRRGFTLGAATALTWLAAGVVVVVVLTEDVSAAAAPGGPSLFWVVVGLQVLAGICTLAGVVGGPDARQLAGFGAFLAVLLGLGLIDAAVPALARTGGLGRAPQLFAGALLDLLAATLAAVGLLAAARLPAGRER